MDMTASHTNLPPDLSIIIPALNEAAKIQEDIRSAGEFCHRQGIRAEMVISDDGSTDETVKLARQCQEGMPDNISLVVLESTAHHGKGHAVRRGMLAAEGAIVMFADSGENVAWTFILEAMVLLKGESCAIVHGSRKLPGSRIVIRQPIHRRILSMLFHSVSCLILPIPNQLTDTQCGFKIYNQDTARTLYQECALEGFLFDLEIILRAQNKGLVIREIPIDWRCDMDSRLRLQTNLIRMGKEFIFLINTFSGRRRFRLNRNK